MSRKGPGRPEKAASAADLRRQRLAEALRANLKRRKAPKAPKLPAETDSPAHTDLDTGEE